MLRIDFDHGYNRQANQELTIFRKVRVLEERVSFWKGIALWCCALLFLVLSFIVAFGVG